MIPKTNSVILAAAVLCSWPLRAGPFFNWETEDAATQVAKDPALIPIGLGAIFVPAMTKSYDEPPALLFSEGVEIGEVPVGHLSTVEPGQYDLLIGSGSLSQRMSIPVVVDESHTSIVEPEWAVLVVRMVTERNFSVRDSYELIEMGEKDNLGVGLGAKEDEGERLQAWILKPSLYKLIKTGENYKTLSNFFTFTLDKGQLHVLTVVVDEATGDFRGAGVVDESLQTKTAGNWKYYFNLSGDFLFNGTRNVQGRSDGYILSGAGIVDASLRYNRDHVYFFSKLEGEEGFTKQKDRPFVPALDKAKVNSIAIYRLLSWFGPYTRVGLESNFLRQFQYFDHPTTVRYLDPSGRMERQETGLNKAQLSSPFSLVEINEGLGANFDVISSALFDIYLRAGLGFRQRLVRDVFSIDSRKDSANPPEISLKRLADLSEEGHEYILIGNGSLFDRISLNTEFDLFFPFDSYRRTLINWSNRVGFRLTSFSSVNFSVDVDKQIDDSRFQTDYRLIFRFSINLL